LAKSIVIMETNNMGNSVFTNIFDLQTRLFNNVIDGVDDSHAATRANEKVNHAKWLAGHLVSTRHMLAGVLSANAAEKYADLYAQGKGLQPGADYPPLADIRNEWQKITDIVRPLIADLKKETLDSATPFPVPVAEQNVNGFICFILHHEAYHLGQLGLLRKYHGYEPMIYK
jgi:hypothetical protein